MILHFVENWPTPRRQGIRRNSLPFHTSAKETLTCRGNGKQSLRGRAVVYNKNAVHFTRLCSTGHFLSAPKDRMDTVLVVEDSRPMQRTLQRLFEADGLAVEIAADGVAGLESFRKQTPSVVVLDLKLPRMPGKEVCRAFKAHAALVPVVVLSANNEVEDKVLMLELGADDYVTKPFSPKELLARVRRAMRRTGQLAESAGPAVSGTRHETLAFGENLVDFTSMVVTRGAKSLTLTAQEFKLLKYFANSPSRVISLEELLN